MSTLGNRDKVELQNHPIEYLCFLLFRLESQYVRCLDHYEQDHSHRHQHPQLEQECSIQGSAVMSSRTSNCSFEIVRSIGGLPAYCGFCKVALSMGSVWKIQCYNFLICQNQEDDHILYRVDVSTCFYIDDMDNISSPQVLSS